MCKCVGARYPSEATAGKAYERIPPVLPPEERDHVVLQRELDEGGTVFRPGDCEHWLVRHLVGATEEDDTDGMLFISLARRYRFDPTWPRDKDEELASPDLMRRWRREQTDWKPAGDDQWGDETTTEEGFEGGFHRLTGDQQALVGRHLELAHNIALGRRFRERGLDDEDMIAEAYDALCRAASVFDPAVGPFEHLARKYIVNAILAMFREKKNNRRPINAAKAALLADEHLNAAQRVGGRPTLIARTSLSDVVPPEIGRAIREAIQDGDMTEEDWEILGARFGFDGAGGKIHVKVAWEFGVSEATVKRTLARCIAVLKRRLEIT